LPEIDLYAELGLPWGAPVEAVRAAYRRLAKTAHPDAGGDRAGWERLTLAHEVLTDPAARERYHADGRIEPPAAEQTPEAAAVAMIAAALGEVVERLQHNRASVARPDFLDLVRQMIEANDAERRQQIARAEAAVRALDGQFRRVGGGPNYLQGIVDQHKQRLDGMKTRGRELDAVSARARALLMQYRYAVPALAGAGGLWGRFNGSATRTTFGH